MKRIDEKRIFQIDDNIEKLSKLAINDYNIKIKLHEVRWIGEGSGYIKINSDFEIKFYIIEGNVQYFTEDSLLLNMFSNLKLDLIINKMWNLEKEKDSIMNSYY